AMSRMKEVSVRKIIGAKRKHLIFQFIGESIMISLLSIILAGFIVEMSVGYLSQFLGKPLNFEMFGSPLNLMIILVFSILLGALAGLYPAVYASKFNTIAMLKLKGSSGNGKSTFRNVMVVIQFALSASLIIVSIVVYQQVDFLRKTDLGFNKEHVITITLRPGLRKNLETTKQLFLANPDIKSATYAYGFPGDIVAGDNIIQPIGDKTLSANHFLVDHDYVKTIGLVVIAGRDFDENLASDAIGGFIVNETAVSALGYSSAEEALGKPLSWKMWHYDSTKRGEIIGVVKDFNFESMREQIATSVIHLYPRSYYKMALRLTGDNVAETIKFIEKTWADLEPTWPITYNFIDQDFDKMYKNEQKLGGLITVFTGIGIFIACLGLFGLVSYNTRMRLKEVGVRKVLGANVSQIVSLLARNYLVLLIISSAIAVPFSLYVMNQWLEGFAYRIEINPLVVIISIVSLILIALLTISYQSIKAALTNPVDVLKDE
ncbi:FtsX-like permease family protein, partial [Fulvivirga lutimaris]|uniref:FtsX-like permease family protein n=1 Tax=Fulvivirga lutimaris TaxID=1819566 RepID=UPI0012BCCF3B